MEKEQEQQLVGYLKRSIVELNFDPKKTQPRSNFKITFDFYTVNKEKGNETIFQITENGIIRGYLTELDFKAVESTLDLLDGRYSVKESTIFRGTIIPFEFTYGDYIKLKK